MACDLLTHLLTQVKCRATSVAKNCDFAYNFSQSRHQQLDVANVHTNSTHSIHHLSFQLFLFSFQEHFLPDQNCIDDGYLARYYDDDRDGDEVDDDDVGENQTCATVYPNFPTDSAPFFVSSQALPAENFHYAQDDDDVLNCAIK